MTRHTLYPFQQLYILLAFVLFTFACNDDTPLDEVNEREFLLDYERIGTIDADQLRGVALIFQPTFDASAIQYNSDLYKISYRTSHKGEEITASGLVCVPINAETEDLPFLLGFHPSIGSQREAPSNFQGSLQSGVELFGAVGYITVIPDYVGYGSSANYPHPYLVGESVSVNSIEMLQAVEEFLVEQEQAYRQEISMIGYSQGAYNAIATLRYFESEQPLPDWEIAASAIGGGVYDLQNMRANIFQKEVYGAPQNIAFLIHAYHEYYDFPGDYQQYFQGTYADFVSNAFGNDLSLGSIRGRLNDKLEELLQPDFLEGLRTGSNQNFNDALEGNTIEPWSVQSPLHIYHASQDSVISIENSLTFYQELEALGSAQISYTELTEPETHTSAGAPMLLDGILWLLNFQDN